MIINIIMIENYSFKFDDIQKNRNLYEFSKL